MLAHSQVDALRMDIVCRYDMSGMKMPYFRPWFEANMGVRAEYRTPSQIRTELHAPEAVDNQEFIDFLKANDISYSNAAQHRIVRSHGHTGTSCI